MNITALSVLLLATPCEIVFWDLLMKLSEDYISIPTPSHIALCK